MPGPLTRSQAQNMFDGLNNNVNNTNELSNSNMSDQNEKTVEPQGAAGGRVGKDPILSEVERAKRGLHILNNTASFQQTPVSTNIRQGLITEEAIGREEVKKILAEGMKAQTDSMTRRFTEMMTICIAELRGNPPRESVPPEVHHQPNIPNAGFATSSEPNDSYQNIFGRRQNINQSNQEHLSAHHNRAFIRREDFLDICFDGKNMSVRQFIFRLSRLKESNDVTWEYIVKHFYRCVKGYADTWYCALVKKVENAKLDLTWNVLKDALENDFGGRQTDADISNMMWGRKQKYNESFEEFFEELMKLNNGLSVPKDDSEIINILKSNCSNRIVSGVYNYSSKNAQDFRRQCMKYELEVEKRFKNNSTNSAQYSKKISELETGRSYPDLSEKEQTVSSNPDCQVEALNMSKLKPKVKCGHCQQPVIFCYRCFTPDVMFPDCTTCHPENSKGSGSIKPPTSHSS